MTTAEVLRAARAKLEDEKRWSCAHNPQGYGNITTGAVCPIGAVYLVVNGWSRRTGSVDIHSNPVAAEACDVFEDVVLTADEDDRDIELWNDDPSRTHAEVLAAFDRAIELAEAER